MLCYVWKKKEKKIVDNKKDNVTKPASMKGVKELKLLKDGAWS